MKRWLVSSDIDVGIVRAQLSVVRVADLGWPSISSFEPWSPVGLSYSVWPARTCRHGTLSPPADSTFHLHTAAKSHRQYLFLHLVGRPAIDRDRRTSSL